MTVETACLLKGYLIGQNAPEKIMEAIEAVIERLKAEKPEMIQHQNITFPVIPLITLTDTSESQQTDEQPKQKKKRNWSPEARAAAAERMKAMRTKKVATPGEAQAPSKAGA